MENKDTELTIKQAKAVIRGINLGGTLQKDHPEIADLYRQGCTLPRIIGELNIQEEYGVGYHVAWTGVQRAISGHNGSFNINSYSGLIDMGEREIISRKHIQEGGSGSGRRMYEEKRGIHGRTPEQRAEDGRKGGRKAGRKTYEQGVGIHGRTSKQHSEDGRKGGKKGGRKSAIARGFIPWTEDEISLAYQLSQQPEYQWGKGTYEGKPNIKKITQELFRRGYSNRTNGAVQCIIPHKRKFLEDRV